MKKIIFGLFIFSLFLASCSKETNHPGPVVPPRDNETPLATTIQADPSSFTLAVHDPQAKELGYLFIPAKNGVIYSFGIRMPQTAQDFRVTLWDTLTKQIIKQKTITNTSTTGFSYVDLGSSNEEIDVTANKAYIISVNTAPLLAATGNRQWYLLSKSGGADFLPITKGHIKILSGRYSDAEPPGTIYPDKDNFSVFGLHLLFGLVDIGYYATQY